MAFPNQGTVPLPLPLAIPQNIANSLSSLSTSLANPLSAAAIDNTSNVYRQARRLYVGNIPLDITEDEVAAFFNQTFAQNNATSVPGDAVTSVQINLEKNFAFLEVSFFLFFFFFSFFSFPFFPFQL